jgi:two-component system response regulator HydG
LEKILIIDDDVDICVLLKRFLERNGYEVKTSFKGQEGLQQFANADFDVVLTDFRLPDMDGIDVLKSIKKSKPNVPVIVITGYSDVGQAVKVIRLGAFEYVTKPIFPEEILMLVKDALDKRVNSDENNSTSNRIIEKPKKSDSTKTNDYIFGKSPSAKRIQKLIELVAPTDMTVVVLGESGTGKEVAARMIHNSSKRKDQPFVAVDCGALPKELAASELFGHEKGAFTGAISAKKGHFEMANGGTLFLDEIGNLSYENQIKLLRVLQERVIRRMGSEKDIPVNVRIIVATNEDLKSAMSRGEFREDIFYRINEFNINLPSINENKEDLEEYLYFFLEKSNQELDKQIDDIDNSVIEIFKKYSWPGNIREIKNVVKRLVLLTEGKTISKNALPSEFLNATLNQVERNNNENNFNLKSVVEQAESETILKALKATNFNKSKCAELLGVDRKTLYNKMNAYGLIN